MATVVQLCDGFGLAVSDKQTAIMAFCAPGIPTQHPSRSTRKRIKFVYLGGISADADVSAEVKRRARVALGCPLQVRPSVARQIDHSRPASADGAVAPSRCLRGVALRMRGMTLPPAGVRLCVHAAPPTFRTLHRIPHQATVEPPPPAFILSCSRGGWMREQ